jgi:hypothetical protein
MSVAIGRDKNKRRQYKKQRREAEEVKELM